ncbi:MAG: hypothetical protein SFW67_15990 [Myxococcaceae bacterium]|nr:hypothetical protein [Myxococcaceae bacterium]
MRSWIFAVPMLVLAACPTPILPGSSCSTDTDCLQGFECRPLDDGGCSNSCGPGLACPAVCLGACQPRRAVDGGGLDAGAVDAGARDAGVNLCASFVPPCRSDFDCRGGESCLPPEDRRCAPSACGCDPATGNIACTADCNGRICRPRSSQDAGPNLCLGFEPPCRSDAQCGPGRACLRDPNQCNPSACGCDPATGDIICTEDCGGGFCGVAPVDAGAPDAGVCVGFRPPCASDSQCLRGEACVRNPGICQPSACACGPTGIVCTSDCGGGVCQARDAGASTDAGTPDGGFCVGFIPPCSNDAMCGPGNRCVRDPNQCTPSACGCDPSSGSIACTADCGGGVCRPQAPDAGACVGFEPPCSSNAMCGPGRVCRRDPSQCVPSACGCDATTGAIFCTSDCGGGTCTATTDAGTPDAGLCAAFDPPCSSNAQCRAGTTCRAPPNACTPSACGCDPSTGNITCTADCGGRRCLP